MRTYLLGGLGIIGAIITWHLLYVGPLSDTPLPSPITTAEAGADLLISSSFWLALWVTIKIAIVGFLTAAVVGIVVGLLCGRYPLVGSAFKVLVEFLKPIPPIVILPLDE